MANSDHPRYWFPAKTYGWGWGWPSAWQGWAALAGYLVLLCLAIAFFPPGKSPSTFVASVSGLSAVLVAICWLKGQPPASLNNSSARVLPCPLEPCPATPRPSLCRRTPTYRAKACRTRSTTLAGICTAKTTSLRSRRSLPTCSRDCRLTTHPGAGRTSPGRRLVAGRVTVAPQACPEFARGEPEAAGWRGRGVVGGASATAIQPSAADGFS